MYRVHICLQEEIGSYQQESGEERKAQRGMKSALQLVK